MSRDGRSQRADGRPRTRGSAGARNESQPGRATTEKTADVNYSFSVHVFMLLLFCKHLFTRFAYSSVDQHIDIYALTLHSSSTFDQFMHLLGTEPMMLAASINPIKPTVSYLVHKGL